jgi:hypothetical protein
MTFLNPVWLFALPLILLPIVIHLLNQRRHRTVDWGAMQFLLSAKKMSRGMARLKQWLIMAMRMLVIAGLIFVVCRPLSSGFIGSLTGGKPETVVVLLDRSASMQQQRLQTGQSKLALGREKIAAALQTMGGKQPIVLIESCQVQPVALGKPGDLLDLPAASETDAQADVPAMLDAALNYINDNQTGRTDVWICSDSAINDWRPDNSQWTAIKSRFAKLEGVRFHVLNFSEPVDENLSVAVTRHDRVDSAGKSELVLDLSVERSGDAVGMGVVPVTFNINGIRSVLEIEMEGETATLTGHRIPIDRELEIGWGQVELPLDANMSDNSYFFAFGNPTVRKTIVVTDDAKTLRSLDFAAATSTDGQTEFESTVLASDKVSDIDWQETAFIVWQAPLPGGTVAKQLMRFVESGRTVLFLPPDQPGGQAFAGVQWGEWIQAKGDGLKVGYWNNDSDLLAKTKNGDALPLNEILVYQHASLTGECRALAKLDGETPLLVRANTDVGGVYFLATLPAATHSSFAREGVSIFAMVHRAIANAADSLGATQHFTAGTTPAEQTVGLKVIAPAAAEDDVRLAGAHPFYSGVYGDERRLVALNRPVEEDRSVAMAGEELRQLFEGLDYHVVEDSLSSKQGLASEIWKAFIVLTGLALLLEAWFCMPPKPVAKEAVLPSANPTRRAA